MNVYRPEERRLVLRLMAYWDDLRNDRDYPTAAEIDPQAIGDDWPYCCVLALRTPLSQSVFTHVGNELFGNNEPPSGDLMLAATPEQTLLRHAVSYLERMLEKQVPVSLGGEAQLDEGPVLYRSILLPLSDDGRTIDHILGAANFRQVVAETPETAANATGDDPA